MILPSSFFSGKRNGAKTDLDLLIGDRIAVVPDLEDGFAQLVFAGDGEFGDLFRMNMGEEAFQIAVGQRREQHPAERGGDRRQAKADLGADGNDAFRRGMRDHHHVFAVQHGGRTGFADLFAQPFQRRLHNVGNGVRLQISAREV